MSSVLILYNIPVILIYMLAYHIIYNFILMSAARSTLIYFNLMQNIAHTYF